ncbi:hypothetical protein GCM10009775_02860 [Microbacterium aoyamense]|uniref:Uncharacterized protein n=1 Tax=Microbacterium aoyamense TaxID=344166 RepID=A0ABN2P7V7_9MICO
MTAAAVETEPTNGDLLAKLEGLVAQMEHMSASLSRYIARESDPNAS